MHPNISPLRWPAQTARRHDCGSSAFTLMELLVVVAIVGILAAILFAAVGHVREAAQTSTCLSNLRQIQAANMLHAADNKGYFVRIKLDNKWWNVQEEFIRYLNAGKQTDSEANSMADELKCPAAAGFLKSLGSSWESQNFPGYGYSSAGVKVDPTRSGTFTALNQSVISNPVKVVAFTDALDFYYYKTPPSSYKWDAEKRISVTRSYRHHDGGCVVYFDGHTEWLSQAQIEKE